MNQLLFEAQDGTHRLVYIEYWDGKPHSAISELVRLPGAATTWDIEVDQKREGYYMFYDSGGFGLAFHGVDIQADQYWIVEGVRIDSVSERSQRLDAPLDLTLFEEGREVLDLQYCKVCDAHYDEDWCWLHHREKKGGGVGYRKGFRKRDLPGASPSERREEAG